MATDLITVADLVAEPYAIEAGGWWAVVGDFSGTVTGYRFTTIRHTPLPDAPWPGVSSPWHSTLDRTTYMAAVSRAQQAMAAGIISQVNIVRLLSAVMPAGASPLGLATVLAQKHPARYAGVVDTGTDWVVSASPELYLARDGQWISSTPIKGTVTPGTVFPDKDVAENQLVAQMVRSELLPLTSQLTVEPSIRLPLPGLDHLATTVHGDLAPGVLWSDIFAASFPPASVTGVPRQAATEVIGTVEPAPRGAYCGMIGFVDADRGRAELAVGIRTFFTRAAGRTIVFGTGAGITPASDPAAEWEETELKARKLVALAS